MPTQKDEQVVDSPTGWVAKHIQTYVESGGKTGHRWNGVNTLLLTTRGRTTGVLHRTALIYGQDGDRYLVVASAGGAKDHPNWYKNLAKHPEVTVQVGPDVFKARARTANAKEKPPLWKTMAGIFPQYNTYQKRTKRDIPVVILERV